MQQQVADFSVVSRLISKSLITSKNDEEIICESNLAPKRYF